MEQDEGLNRDMTLRVATGLALAGLSVGVALAGDKYINHLMDCADTTATVCQATPLARDELIALGGPTALGAFSGIIVVARRTKL